MAADAEDRFGFIEGAIFYQTNPTHPIGDWKEAWETAKEHAAAIVDADKQSTEEPLPNRVGALCSEKKLSKQELQPASLKCRFHDLRHQAVTRLLKTGISYPVVASMMGWSPATAIRMAKRYGHIGSQALREAADVLGRTRILMGPLKKSLNSLEAGNAVLQ